MDVCMNSDTSQPTLLCNLRRVLVFYLYIYLCDKILFCFFKKKKKENNFYDLLRTPIEYFLFFEGKQRKKNSRENIFFVIGYPYILPLNQVFHVYKFIPKEKDDSIY
ncbi:hypothetical protein BJ944DRAFT_286012 [Cunninghamella echinulata]|nr:hypothetical protein BJ944DRAFT_286012 [Cunninghamella echinulata]